MKIFVAAMLAVVLGAAAYLAYEIGALRGRQGDLEERLSTVATAADSAAQDAADRHAAKLQELSLRISALEEAARSGEDGAAARDAKAEPEVAAALATHAEELDAIRKELDAMRRTRGAIDRTADRVLEAVGQAAPAEGGQPGGLAGLLEMGELMRKRPEDLTPEEKARRDEIASQLRARQTDWAVRAFDRSLTTKLTDEQSASLQQMLADENAALAEVPAGSTDDERSASQKSIRDGTDERAAALLSADQYESWKTYRSRPARGGRMFGRRE